MGRIVIALIVACMAVSVYAIVCTPNFCDNAQCTVTKENCNGEFDPHGGLCGCCALCITIIPPGGNCFALAEIFTGFPPSTRCVEGTSCINGTCQLPYYYQDYQ